MAGMRSALSLAAGLALGVLLALIVPAQQHVAPLHVSRVAITIGVADDLDTDADTDTHEHRVDVGVLVWPARSRIPPRPDTMSASVALPFLASAPLPD